MDALNEGSQSLFQPLLLCVLSMSAQWLKTETSVSDSRQLRLSFLTKMPRGVREAGLIENPPPRRSFAQWQKDISESWFTSQSAFLAHVANAPIDFPKPFFDTPATRAMGIFANFGLIKKYSNCFVRGCHSKAVLSGSRRSDNNNVAYKWLCATMGAKHMQECVVGLGLLEKIKIGGWMPFLNVIVLLRLGKPLQDIYQEVKASWGNIDEKTFRTWRQLYQQGLQNANEELDLLKIGGARPQQLVVIDESHIGVLKEDGEEAMCHSGISKGAPRVRSTSRASPAVMKRIAATLPARTLWKGAHNLRKRPAAKPSTMKVMNKKVMKKKAMKKKIDARSSGRWLWAAVSVGYGRTRFTHGNQLKRFTWKILPHKDNAIEGKPKGKPEIVKAMREYIHKGSKLIFDGWRASESAAKELGFAYAPPVVHEVCWRDVQNGWHSNDIESEFSRLKTWSRRRYGKLSITELDLHEYTFYVNAGNDMSTIMNGLFVGGDTSGRKFRF
jgi:hypothetical protein